MLFPQLEIKNGHSILNSIIKLKEVGITLLVGYKKKELQIETPFFCA
jgi:hypothetical protein